MDKMVHECLGCSTWSHIVDVIDNKQFFILLYSVREECARNFLKIATHFWKEKRSLK